MACRIKLFRDAFMILAFLHFTDGFTIEQVKKTANMVKDMCIRRTAVNPEQVERATNGDFPEDDVFKCFTKCILEMLQAIRDDMYNPDGLVRMIKILLPPDLGARAMTAIQQCNNAGDGLENICDATYTIMVCFYKKDPDVSVIFDVNNPNLEVGLQFLVSHILNARAAEEMKRMKLVQNILYNFL